MTTKTNKSDLSLKKKYDKFFSKINKIFQERDYEITQLKYAVLIGEHVLFKGAPGTGKSMLARKVFYGFTGSEVYENQFTRFQDDSYVYGPQLLEEFKEGRVIHNTEGSLVTANFGFLDEFFNASEELLVSTNELLNERTFTRPHQKEESPLITAVMTTNQERENEKELKAVYDRIMFKSDVKGLAQATNRIKMYTNFLEGKDQNQPEFDFEDLLLLKEELENYDVEISGTILFIFDSLIFEYGVQKCEEISDRKKNSMLDLVVAHAFLRDADSIAFEDLEIIKYALVEGGDRKGIDYFDSIYKKLEIIETKRQEIEKIKQLYASNVSEEDKIKRAKVLMGLKGKCQKEIDFLKDENDKIKEGEDSYTKIPYTHFIKDLSNIRDKCEDIITKEEITNEDLF